MNYIRKIRQSKNIETKELANMVGISPKHMNAEFFECD